MNRTALTVALTLALGSVYSTAAFSQAKPDVLVKQRQSVMVLVGKYFGPMGLMAGGKIPYDATVAARNAGFLDALSKMPWDGFTADTAGEKSRALPEIYKEPAKFKEDADRFQSEITKLVAATRGGNEGAVRAAIGEVGKACGACHDNFRAR
jgi:cytochrome c556